MELKAFDFEIINGVGRITMNRAELGNPIDWDFCREFKQLAIECDENPAVRSVLIDAYGPYFSVGGDIKGMIENRAALASKIKSAASELHEGIARMSRMDAPVVVAAKSMVAGGANGLVAAADLVIAAEDTKFYAAFTMIGFSCDTGSTYFMPRRVGSRKATEFYLLNQTWTAAQALDYGLINMVVPDHELSSEAKVLAEELACGPTCAHGEIKRLMLSSFEQSLEKQLADETNAIARTAKTDDSWNALNALLLKQDVEFSGC
ncbi:MAG: enoyl-CoA hydratase/isomerase family protein [Gammaproteobacteria bacterium]|nr:enoyl-CoA hydratase/isomerase family protein [Gammaproteobacteria bacterium]